MKEILIKYAEYNIWANGLLIEELLKLEEEQIDKEIVSSFPSIRQTVYHVWSAEFIWLERLQKSASPVWLAANFKGTLKEACHHWKLTSESLLHYINEQYDDNALNQILHYVNMKKIPFDMAVKHILLHIFNHSTQHRGQLFTMLRQVGVTKIPATDFYVFANLN